MRIFNLQLPLIQVKNSIQVDFLLFFINVFVLYISGCPRLPNLTLFISLPMSFLSQNNQYKVENEKYSKNNVSIIRYKVK